MKYFFKKALLPDGWRENVRIEIADHRIVAVDADTDAAGSRVFDGVAVPGMTNVHSHAFQFGFAGLSEYRTGTHDSFWTWQKRMYEFVDTITPEKAHAIGKQLYARMLAVGYTTVGEFHYLLHQRDGTPYENNNEMADALIAAAKEAGMRICMLPVLYQRGGFDESPLAGGQLRFGSSNALYLDMLSGLQSRYRDDPAVSLGVALHSLRAVSVAAAQQVLKDARSIVPDAPIHIHVAEQVKEVEDCVAVTGKRPVELLLDSFEVDEKWCLIHATHMSDRECQRLAGTGAVSGVCPTTEANLGDGVFRAEDWLKLEGKLAIGSDSHVSVDVAEELRILEYAQRLTQQRRAVLCTDTQSCGSLLYQWSCAGGAQVTGFGDGGLSVGNLASISVMDERFEDVEFNFDGSIFHPNATRASISGIGISAV